MLKSLPIPGSLESRFTEMLSQLRRLVRADGVAGILLTVSLWAVISMGLDWTFELARPARAVILVLLGLLLARALVVLGARLRRAVSERTLAMSVERSRPELEGHLLNALGFEGSLADTKLKGSTQLEMVLLRRALLESERAVRGIPFTSGLDYRPFYRRAAATGAATALLAVLSFAFPAATGLWVKRDVLLRDIPWPRDTTLVLDRLEPVWHCARGESVPLLGRADGKVPSEVTVWMKSAAGTRHASFIPGANGRLAFTFPEVVEPFEFHLRGGDGRTEPRTVEVHDRPRVLAVSFALVFPEYLARAPEGLENTARDLVIPAGTTVVVRARADVPLQGGTARWEKDEPQKLAPMKSEGDLEKMVEHRFKPEKSGSLDVAVIDRAWGLESRPPSRVRVDVRPDTPPKITLALKQKARVVTPAGSVAYKVEARDDHGFSKLGLETSVGSSAPEPRLEKTTFEGIPAHQGEVTREGMLDLQPLQLEPGMRLTLTAEGADDDGLAGPKAARSNSELLAVVGPEEFRDAMARARAAARRELEDALQEEEKIAGDLASATGAEDAESAPSPSSASKESGGSKAATSGRKGARSEDGAKDRPGPREDAGKKDAGEKTEGAEVAAAGSGDSKSSDSKSSSAKSAEGKGSQGKSAQGKSAEGKSAEGKSAEGKSAEAGSTPEASPAAGSAASNSRSPSSRQASPSSASKMAGIARTQAESGRRVSRAAQELRDVAESLEQNKMMDRTERTRFDAEVLAPLDDLGEERYPRTSRDIAGIEKSEDPRKESSRARAELNQIQESLKNVLDRLSDTEDFSDILHRLEGVLQLHRKAIDSTREKTAAPPAPAGKGGVPRKEDL
jgi:hypothetical protein